MVLRVGAGARGQRLDHFLVEQMPEWSRSHVSRLIHDGHISLNDRPPRKLGQAVDDGDVITIRVPELVLDTAPGVGSVAERLGAAVVVLYEDDDLLAIDKPSGLPVHRGPGHAFGTLVDALIARGTTLASAAGDARPGIVHRLDMETSGVMLVAKTNVGYHSLSDQFMRRSVRKSYVTLLRGRLKTAEGTIEAPIGRDPDHRQRMAIVSGGRKAETAFTVLAHLDGHTLVDARPRTGRSHQIRVHFASLGHPVAGDGAYSRDRHGGAHRLFLHAARLEFEHPTTGERMVIVSPLAADLEQALRELAGDDYQRVARTLDQLPPATK